MSWTINGTGCSGSSCGSVTPGSGSILYTAPQTVASQLHATIDANLASVGSFGSIAVTVNPALTVAANLDAASVGVPYSGTITTSGGSNPVQTSIAAGSLPSGLALDSTGSKIAGTPSTAGSFTFTIKATDASNATTNVLTQKTIRVASTSTPVSVVTSSLPKATVGTAYATQLAATGGTSPYTWSILSGALPTGVTLVSSSGIIHGTPTASGTFGISVQATDKDGATATTTLSITVANAQPTLQITTTALASGTVGIPYTSAIDTSGGTAPYTCARVSGSLPAGLALNACTISGTPTASGTFSFSVSVTDSTGAYTAGTISLNIAASSLRVTTTLLPSGTVGTPYTTAITAAGGTAPYTCSIRSGTLPAGLALSGCNITGTPTTAGSSTLVLGVTDAAGISVASASLGLTIANAAPTLTISSPTSATVGASYAASIGIAGGTAPYSCSLTSGSLPTGISLSNCSLRGTPMASGVFALNISATDSSTPSGKGSGNISLVVQNAPPTLTITSPSTVTAGQVYSSAIGVRGGLAPYTCSLISGTLPSGLTLSNCNITGTTAVTGSNNLVIRATDSSSPAGTATSAITLTVVSPPATLTISSPPSGTVGAAYNGAIGVSGGTAPYTCALASGAVPAGLTLNGCSLSGIPTVAGNATFAIRATDASNPANSTTATVTLSIAAAPVTLTLTAPSAATAGVVYSGAIGVSGGTAPYTCALTSGFMPAGLTLNSCSITGTPTVAGTFNLNIRASDSATPANATTATVPLTIASTPVIPVTMTLTSTTTTGTVGSAYAGIIGISGGTAPYTCSLTSGSVPGLTLNNCTLTGTPTTAGTYSLSLRASDSASPANSTTGTIALTVNAAAVALSITSPSSGTVGTAYTGTIGVSGGTAPYTCSLASGTLPAGLTLSNCSFSGTPTAAGTTTLSIRATDASNPANAATGNVSITINATPVFGSSSAPHINYTDINVGSGTGGDTGNGVYVRIFGNNFGATQGSSTVTLGGSLVTNCSLCSWSDTVIIAQLGSAAKTGNIIVTVNGSASNGMPFTVTATDIVFVSPNGADTNTGSFSSPYKTWRRAFNSVTSSDSSSPVRNTVIYLMPGTDVTFDDGRGYKAAISTDIGGSSATSQLNIVGYPGGTVNVGSTSVTNGIKGWGKYITAANLNIVGQVSAVDAEAGNVRIINNSISCPAPPSGVGGTACVLGETTDPTETWVFHGNNVHDTGGNVDKTYHAVYFSSNVNHAEVGWNNVGQNFKGYCRGIMFHATLGANQFDLHIHDNVVTNSYCDGIGLASVDPSQGTVEVYNNLVLHTALATNPYGVANEAGIAINSDPAPGSSTGNVEVYNNTVVDAGAYTTGNQNGCFGVVYSGAGMHLTNNICSQPSSAQPYVEKGSTNVSGSHNLWYGAGSAPSWDTNPVNANPLFTSATDFSLQSGSPAKATGTSSNASSVDIVGNSRGSTPSMGAYQ